MLLSGHASTSRKQAFYTQYDHNMTERNVKVKKKKSVQM